MCVCVCVFVCVCVCVCDRERESSLLYLTFWTVFSSLPSTLLPTLPIEWWPSTQHHVDYHAKTPKITLFIVVERLPQKRVHYLGSHVLCRTHWCGEHGRGHRGVVTADHTAEVKVTNTNWSHLHKQKRKWFTSSSIQ